MEYNIPSAEEVAAKLQGLDTAALRELAAVSGVPFTTLWKIKSGETTDPRLNTIRDLAPHLVKREELPNAAGSGQQQDPEQDRRSVPDRRFPPPSPDAPPPAFGDRRKGDRRQER